MREKAVLCKLSADTGEAGKAGVSRESQDEQDAGNCHIVKNTASGNRRDQLRQNGLIAGLSLVHRANLISSAEVSYAQQQQRQDHDDDRQGAMGVFDFRFSKQWHSIADCFDASHGRATIGKGTQHNPRAHCLGRGGKRRRWYGGLRLSAAQPNAHEANDHGSSEAGDKRKRGQPKRQSRFAHAPQIDDRQY